LSPKKINRKISIMES